MSTTPITIEKKIAPPSSNSKYPFADMKVGDSFLVAEYDAGPLGSKLRSAAAHYSTRNAGWKFTVRKVNSGYRVWRIKAE